MGKTKYGTRYPDELRARAVRMVLDHEEEYASRSAAILSISQKVGCSQDSLRIWVKQHETDTGKRDGMTTAEGAVARIGLGQFDTIAAPVGLQKALFDSDLFKLRAV